MQPEFQAAFKAFRDQYAAWRSRLAARREEITQNLTLEELADQAYMFREMKGIAEELTKAIEECNTRAQRMACLKWLSESATGEPIRTEHCTATPDVKMLVRIPSRKRRWQEYCGLMQWLGVPSHLYERSQEEGVPPVVDIHYRGLLDYVAETQERGEHLPDGLIDPSGSQLFTLRILGKKGVDET